MTVVEVVVSGRSPLAEAQVVDLVQRVLRGERRGGHVSVTFVGRDRMRRMHEEFKGIARVTDVLAFALPGPAGDIVGDVYVCPWVARREARRHRLPVRQELSRYIIHGVLHVLGYDHPDDESRLHSPMWRRQERYLEAGR